MDFFDLHRDLALCFTWKNDLALYTDTDFARLITMSQTGIRCINCDIRLSRIRRHAVREEDESVVRIIKLWTYPRELTNNDYICHSCWELAKVSGTDNQAQVQRQVGHRSVCLVCGRSILKIDSRIILSYGNENIASVISGWVQPRQVLESDQACVPCWLKAQRVTRRQSFQDSSRNVQMQEGIVQDEIEQDENLHVEIVSDNIVQGFDTEIESNDGCICVNCDTQIPSDTSHSLNENLMSIIKLWTYPRNVTISDRICNSCWELATYYQLHNCIVCGASVNETESHAINRTSDEGRQIAEIINLRIQPRQVTSDDGVCVDCWGQARQEIISTDEQRLRRQSITLPNIKRVAETARYCLFQGCTNPERNHVPDSIRRRILKENNFYIPRESRICNYHFHGNFYDQLYTAEYSIDYFNPIQIEDMIFILTEQYSALYFDDIEGIPDHLVNYWIGITKQQYRRLLNECPRLQNTRRGSLALTALLCKLRTGDSGDRMSTLFQIPRRTLETLMTVARELLLEEFVPRHLGIGHISREEVARRNSLIADGIFGNPEEPLERKPAIVIADGTYIYTQKSSNYLFQKKTYSLHKFRNLVKPFLLACCDGYVLDVFGLYNATTNDATIMNSILENESFCNFFNEGDVFILDRGFRDVIDKIQDKGFEAFMPETLSPGHSQLSTLEGNRSRCVTLNRWVIEAVNGHIKRDFKLFRQEYFNRASTHLLKDLKIAIALLNCFGTRFTDPENATEILNIVNERLFLDNTLAALVAEERLSRRHAYFTDIDATNISFPRMTLQELVLFACGTYQIRQARSYIGEQFRFYGIYRLSVCREQVLNLGGENAFLIRAQIKSRYVGRKSYYVFVLVEREQQGRDAIIGYCCNCIVGLRTVGCCSHVMSVVWFLSYARHEGTTAPAQFLDDVLIQLES